MLDDEIGMHTDEIKKILLQITDIMRDDNKRQSMLENINVDGKSAYKSSKSVKLNANNNEILNNIKIKTKNINSYIKYIERQEYKYINVTKNAIEDLSITTKKYKE